MQTVHQEFARRTVSLGRKDGSPCDGVRASPRRAGSRAKGSRGSARGKDKAPPGQVFEAAVARFEAARQAAERAHGGRERAREAALNEEVAAADALAELIRGSAPGGGDPAKPHAARHPDGRVIVAMPAGVDVVIAGRVEYLVVVPPAQQADFKGGRPA